MNKLLKEPLLHFVILGAAMFAAFTAMQDNKNYHPPGSIAVTPGRILQMTATFKQSMGHKPTEAELAGLIDAYVHDEILVREAMKMGLDQDDPVIRATLIEKVKGLADFGSGAAAPTDADLQAFMDAHADQFKVGGALPALAEVREAVLAAVEADRAKLAEDAYFTQLKANYLVEISSPEVKS